MLVVMRAQAGEEDIARVCRRIKDLGLEPHIIPGAQRTAIGITGNQGTLDASEFEALPGVAEAIAVSKPYKLVSREVKPDDTVVRVGSATVGGPDLVFCAGPCSVESREQVLTAARAVKAAGATLLRGGAYKPRTSPYAFQGLGEEGPQAAGRSARGDGPGGGHRGRSTPKPSTWWKSMPTASRSARATCRTFRCCGARGGRGGRCC